MPPAADPYRARLDDLFAEALDLPRAERASFLEKTCADEPRLRAEVEELLHLAGEPAEAFDPGTLVDGPLWRAMASELQAPVATGTRLGAWRLVRELGRGGMGTVYLVERADGAFALTAALKLLRPAAHTGDVLVRFERERQILARLHHPNVARLLDGGRTADGQPYFVMEYVEGEPLDRYCDERRLLLDQRLDLVLKVGRAVQHAHRNLVVHRDLKPSNIVVTREGEVKLLDFGIAKLLAGSDAEAGDAPTRTLARVLTPEYASPEQVRGDPITTASDVYQLGLLLHQLLTGQRAHHFEEGSPAALEEVVCRRAAVPPSRVVAASTTAPETAAARRTTPAALARKLRGDLDTIVLMALRKEPERRYGSAEQLMEDVERYRQGLPVRARRDTLAYRTHKFVRRHALGVATAAAFGMLLVSYAATVTHQARQLTRERDRAETEARKAGRVRDFLVGLFEAADPGQARGEKVTAAELVDAGVRQVREQLGPEPEVQAEMLGVLGTVLHERASYDRAEPLLAEALAIQRRLHPEGHPDLARALLAYGDIVTEKGDYARAEQLGREALAIDRRLSRAPDEEVAAALARLSVAVSLQGRFIEAEALLREGLSIRRALPGAQDAGIADLYGRLGVQLAKQRKHAQAEAAYRAGLEIERRLYPPDHPTISGSSSNLAVTLNSLGKLTEAESLYRESLVARRRLYGDQHPLVANVLHNMGTLQRRLGRIDEAVATHRVALAVRRQAFGHRHSNVALSLNALASAFRDGGRMKEAEACYREALAMFRDTGHWALSSCVLNLGLLLSSSGRAGEAEPLLREALALRVGRDGETSAAADEARLGLGLCLVAQGRTQEARPLLGPALERVRGATDIDPPLLAESEAAWAGLLARDAGR